MTGTAFSSMGREVPGEGGEDDVRPAYGTPARAAISVDAPMVEAREIGTPPVTTAAAPSG